MGRKKSRKLAPIIKSDGQVVKQVYMPIKYELSLLKRIRRLFRISGYTIKQHGFIKSIYYGWPIWKNKSLAYYAYKRKCKKLGKRPPYTKPEIIKSNCFDIE